MATHSKTRTAVQRIRRLARRRRVEELRRARLGVTTAGLDPAAPSTMGAADSTSTTIRGPR